MHVLVRHSSESPLQALEIASDTRNIWESSVGRLKTKYSESDDNFLGG